MEKVLFVAYQFPPRGGPGVQRSAALVKNLRSFGYDPVVLTIREEDIKQGGYQMDHSLLNDLPAELEIVRVPSYEPVALTRGLMKLRLFRVVWFLFFPRFRETSSSWPSKVAKEAEVIVKKHNIRLVYTTSGPYSSMELGKYLQEKLAIKWVADLRDPYTDAYAWQFPSRFHWLVSRRYEKTLFALPDKLIVNTPEVKKLYLSRGIIPESKITVITNGF
jgi:glycosyltransferase involved in cell wall biosynthesis